VAKTLGKFVWEVREQMTLRELREWYIFFLYEHEEQERDRKKQASKARAKQAGR